MTDHTLRACRIIVVEDEYMLAEDLESELLDAEAIILGPVGTVSDALALIESEHEIDGAILDVNLGGEMVFPVADVLVSRRVPLVFTTGYDASVIPRRFQSVMRCEKPVDMAAVAVAIGRLIHPSGQA